MDINKPTDEQLQEFLMFKYLEHQAKLNMQDINQHEEDRKAQFEAELRKVTPRDFANYLDAKGIRKTCVLCGSESLSVPEGGVIDSLTLPADFDERTREEKQSFFTTGKVTYVGYITLGEKFSDVLTKTYYPMHCLNCGNLHLIRVRKVLDWLKDQSKEEGSNV
ncbi:MULTISPECIES: hypothetical protein [Klebsiella]|uniref:hypothetical protein n=1 Tax=Klebsiella TaxID=570 RepID=UPI000E2B8391|nr:hypothetical protein [Klebsiella pneumoniae]SWP90498.1 Uncharacterised protein [Klebsiella pneumoniae]